ncbi:MAG: hypothetical protein E7294_14335 [Lachnospiraceae bacterium]|nr:hypothetical protein [Lachnospiraceae bacterium]
MVLVYELKYSVTLLLCVLWLIVGLAFLWCWLRLPKCKIWWNVPSKEQERMMRISAAIVAGIMIIADIFTIVMTHDLVYIPYKEGVYSVIEGEVSNFETNSKDESFELNGVRFSYQSNDPSTPYRKIKADGGYILDNSQHIKVAYVTGRRNYIVKLWVEEKDYLTVKNNPEWTQSFSLAMIVLVLGSIVLFELVIYLIYLKYFYKEDKH